MAQVTTFELQAKWDGQDYLVQGSPIVDTIAYTPIDSTSVRGVGKKGGVVCFEEVVEIDVNARTLTQTYLVRFGGKEVAGGSAVFQKFGQ